MKGPGNNMPISSHKNATHFSCTQAGEFIPSIERMAVGMDQRSLAFAQQPRRVPSHCGRGEYAYLNAHMSEIRRSQEGGYTLIKTGKLLSICTDSQSEPFRMVAYRFGPVGKVEMESVASESKKFFLFERSTSPHTGENIVFFNAGAYTYCISEATAQGSGIGLSVFRSGRQVLDLFSGNERGEDFESEMINMNFFSPKSPVFQIFRPSNSFQTPCDPASGK